MSQKQNNDDVTIVSRIQSELLPLLETALSDDAVVYNNPHLVNCWKVKNCAKTCGNYNHQAQNKNFRCWHSATLCCESKANDQETFAQQFAHCRECAVYKVATPTIVEVLGEYLNHYIYLRQQNAEQLHDVAYINQQLETVLTDLDTSNRTIHELAITDQLTGLYNRNHLFLVLEDEIARSQRYKCPLSLFMIDMDNFKSVNDEYGHLAGDRLLMAVGSFLKALCRKTDKCFRFGGEEFVVILPETEIASASIIADRICTGFAQQEIDISDIVENPTVKTISRTLSIGITGFRENATAKQLLLEADAALYEAKSLGKNQYAKCDMSFCHY